MIPIIGITPKYDYGSGQDSEYKKRFFYSRTKYANAIELAGGLPVILPVLKDEKMIEEITNRVHGLIFSGGGFDVILGNKKSCVGVEFYSQNPDRMNFEVKLAKAALRKNIPMIGTCLGHETINVALGGDLTPDITGKEIKHYQLEHDYVPTHSITLEKGSRMHSFFGRDEVMVNSLHVQCINNLAEGLKPVAFSPDGIIEAYESENHDFVLGLQFHPEYLYEADPGFMNIFKALVDSSVKKIEKVHR